MDDLDNKSRRRRRRRETEREEKSATKACCEKKVSTALHCTALACLSCLSHMTVREKAIRKTQRERESLFYFNTHCVHQAQRRGTKGTKGTKTEERESRAEQREQSRAEAEHNRKKRKGTKVFRALIRRNEKACSRDAASPRKARSEWREREREKERKKKKKKKRTSGRVPRHKEKRV